MSPARLRDDASPLAVAWARCLSTAAALRGRRPERGAALVEYALILALVLVAGIGALFLIGVYVDRDFLNSARGLRP